MKIPQLQKKLEVKSCHDTTWEDNYSWIHQNDILEVLYLFSRRINLGPIEKDFSISENEALMIDQFSKNIDMQDISLFGN